ncbi:MAG: nucleoside kinase [Candidatus Bipolaricaulota bacterium]|nr:MAG: nucleoside kinase [Candidatus Bipolaricaulota bacterium]
MNGKAIRPVDGRETVQVKLPDGRSFEGPRGEPLAAFLREAYPGTDDPVVAAVVGGTLRELAWPVPRDVEVRPLRVSDSDGMRIYQRSLSLLLIVAVHELHPEVRLSVDYSVPDGGYYCRLVGRKPFSSAQLGRIATRMRRLVRADEAIDRRRMSVEEAVALFAERGEEEKLALFSGYPGDHVHLYCLRGVCEYAYGYMVPSTGSLRTFALEAFGDGFILRFPRRSDPAAIQPLRRFAGLREVFHEYGTWLEAMGISHVGALNQVITQDQLRQLVLVAEALHEQRIAEIAHQVIRQAKRGARVVLVAGPSASGKTTFSKRLAVQMLATGLRPFLLAMDDYFHPRDELPAIQDHAIDFDALSALDSDLLHDHLDALLAGETVTLPHYDFRTGERRTGTTTRLAPGQVVIAEGIHGLNPELVERRTPRPFCIFVSALTQLNLDRHTRVPTTDTRLIRRIVRDARTRGYSAETTISMWEKVRAGEKRNIFPYQEEANVMFNSALAYELAVMRSIAEPLLLQARKRMARIEAERLLAFLRWFVACDGDSVPGNSILREFIGGSTLETFSPSVPLRTAVDLTGNGQEGAMRKEERA